MEFESAWRLREQWQIFSETEAVRVFHGPGEGKGPSQFFALDRFQNHYWITEWESQKDLSATRKQILKFLASKGAQSVVGLTRPQKGVAPETEVLLGKPLEGRFAVREKENQFLIQLEKSRHPGLFLDHAPLREWLRKYSNGLRVLNTFSYTGSLSVAAATGGAQAVTTLDLGQPVIQWAKENFQLNQIPLEKHSFVAGDVFEWLPRWAREKKQFDCIILDPPSFSHGKKAKFSTSKDLEKLHSLAMNLLSKEGVLITSINSANISWKKYETDVLEAARKRGDRFQVLKQIDLPQTFPSSFDQGSTRYLKGWILKRV